MSTARRIAVALRVDEPYPHHQEILSGVLDYARGHPEWHCVIDEHPTYASSRRGRLAPAYSGVIARASPELQRRLTKLGIPLVNVWYQRGRQDVPGVYPDVAAIGRLAAEHLIERGFRSLAFVGIRGYRKDDEIALGFATSAAARGHTCVIDDYANPDFGDRGQWLALQRNFDELLNRLPRPVGILVTVASAARLLMTMSQEGKQRCARNVGVVCLDNFTSVVEVSPQITCIDGNYFQIGRAAAGMLDELMEGRQPAPSALRVPPKGVILRESTDYFAVQDDIVAEALRYISARLRKPLGVEAIAHAIATSPRTLQRRFEASMGCSVSEEIGRLRVEFAKRLLVDGKLSMEQVAHETGFSSAMALNHFFHRQVGMSPTAYRKQVRGQS
jgi:LacI family transcriptional regulator